MYSASAKSGVTIRKKDGSVIKLPPKKKPVVYSKNDDGLLIIPPEREYIIRRSVRLVYLELDLPLLAEELKAYRKEVLALDKANAPNMTPVYVFNFDDKKRNLKGIPVKLSYSGIDLDGQIVLSLQETYAQEKAYVKTAVDDSLLFSVNKRTANGSEENFLPFDLAKKSKARYGFYRSTLLYFKDVGIANIKFHNLVNKLKQKYIRAIANYYVFLEQHGHIQRVDQVIECAEKGYQQYQIPFVNLSVEQATVVDKRDEDQFTNINDGDKICCKISSIVTVMNTFQCLEKQHHMVRVALEVLIKDSCEDMPFTRELQAYYCKECKRIFMYTSEYERIREYVGNSQYCVFNRFYVDGNLLGRKSIIATSWADESILKEAGYEVNQNSYLTQQDRLSILLALNRRGVPYHAIASYLNTFITVLGSSSSRDMTQAVKRWESDLEAVRKMHASNTLM